MNVGGDFRVQWWRLSLVHGDIFHVAPGDFGSGDFGWWRDAWIPLFLTDDINSDICRFVSLSGCLERQGLQNFDISNNLL